MAELGKIFPENAGKMVGSFQSKKVARKFKKGEIAHTKIGVKLPTKKNLEKFHYENLLSISN